MAKRNIKKAIERGERLLKELHADMGADDLQVIHAAAAGSEFKTIDLTYKCGFAYGYDRAKRDSKKSFRDDVTAWIESLEEAEIDELVARLYDVKNHRPFHLYGLPF